MPRSTTIRQTGNGHLITVHRTLITTSLRVPADYGVGDGEAGRANCGDRTGVPAGEGILDGDAAGEPSFNEEGACINESKESLAALGDGVAVGVGLAAVFVGAGLGFCGVVSM